MENKHRKVFVKKKFYQLSVVFIISVLFTFIILFYHALCISYVHHCNYCTSHQYISISVPNISIFLAEFVYLKSKIHRSLSNSISVEEHMPRCLLRYFTLQLFCTIAESSTLWKEILTSSLVKFLSVRKFSKRLSYFIFQLLWKTNQLNSFKRFDFKRNSCHEVRIKNS